MKKLSLLILLAMFMILPAQAADIQVTAPVGGASWKINTTQTVQWSFSGIPDTAKVYIFLWQNGNKLGKIADMIDIGANGQGSCSWNVGVLLDAAPAVAGSGYFIRVRVVNSETLGESGLFSLNIGSTGTGPQVFQPASGYPLMGKRPQPLIPDVVDVQVKTIQVSDPKAGAHLSPYDDCTIRWKFINIPDSAVTLALLRDGQPVGAPTGSLTEPHEFHWDLKLQQPDPGKYKLAVETLDKAHRGLSGQFTIDENGTVTILSPTGMMTLANGSSLEVKWKRDGNIQKVDIFLIRVAEGSSAPLAAGVDAKLGAKVVVLSPGEAGQYKISIRDSRNQNGLAQSGIFFITVD